MILYSSFEERGYKVEAHIPENSSESLEFKISVYRGSSLVREERVQMDHEPFFGVDTEDRQRLNQETDRIMKELLD